MLKELLILLLLIGTFFFLMMTEKDNKKTKGSGFMSFIRKNKTVIIVISLLSSIIGYFGFFHGDVILQNIIEMKPITAIKKMTGGSDEINILNASHLEEVPDLSNYSIEELEKMRDSIIHKDNLEREMAVESEIDPETVLNTLDGAEIDPEDLVDDREFESADNHHERSNDKMVEQDFFDDIEADLSDYDFGGYRSFDDNMSDI
jgi:hypothetical protein